MQLPGLRDLIPTIKKYEFLNNQNEKSSLRLSYSTKKLKTAVCELKTAVCELKTAVCEYIRDRSGAIMESSATLAASFVDIRVCKCKGGLGTCTRVMTRKHSFQRIHSQ
jgi:hypothetical protein